MNRKILVILGISLMMTFGEGIYSSSQADHIDAMLTTANHNRLFGWDLYAQLKEQEGNLFYSPYSISTALAMTYAGARGETATQMAHVLHFPAQYDTMNDGFRQLGDRFRKIGDSSPNAAYLANALWIDQRLPVLEAFQKLTQTYYSAFPFTVDFREMPEKSRNQINTWISEQTLTKIPELLQQGDITPDTTLALTNAIYFKGIWSSPFDEAQTVAAPFWVSSDTSRTVPMMHKNGDFEYAEEEDFQILALPYAGDRIFMVIFLPNHKEGLSTLETQLHDEAVMQWLARLQSHKVAVSLPKFSARSRFELLPTLQTMGLQDISNFSGISRHPLSLEKIIHEATIDVNEKGTEAAAATAVTMGRSLPRFWDFTADHPFLYFILDTTSNSILFIGRVVDPVL